MKKLVTALALLIAICPVIAADEEQAMVVNIKRLSMEMAGKMAHAAIDACRKEGINISVTVVDRNGIPQVMLRDTLAAHLTIEISKRKAYTAANFNAVTSSLEDRANTAVGRFDDLIMSAGGVPINVGGFIYGGIGVSGAPAGETDEKCAQAGLAAIVDDLEMI